MKKRVLLTMICALSVMMAMAQRTNPDVAEYFIKGYLSIEKGNDGKPVYKLSDIDNQGIYFEDPRATRVGAETKFEDVLFQFSRASTKYPGGINTPLDFWRYDSSIHEWQPDGETRQGTAGVEEKKSMAVMLVLDCSSSIGDDFVTVQEAAKAFIQSLFDASNGAGNIKLGIVSFSKINETQVFNIRSLTPDSYNDMTRFINRLSTQNGTALYYAMDKSVELMEDYCKKSISPTEPLSAAIMVTFTDGLDQTSRNPDKDILTADEYYDEVLSKYGTKMQQVSLNGVSLQHEIRGVQGNDIITEAQLGKFRKTGQSLGNFKLLNNYSELGAEFADIAQNLIDQWRVLNLFVPNSFSGRVAWTYPSRKQVVVEKPKELKRNGKFLFGINVGVGTANNKGETGYVLDSIFVNCTDVIGTFGLDFAFAINDNLNFGLFTSFGYEYSKDWHDYLTINAGPLLMIDFKNSGSLYFGGGVHLGFDVEPYDYVPVTNVTGGGARIGYKLKNGLYLFLEKNYYRGSTTNYGYSSYIKGNNTLVHVGYFF